MKLSFKNRDLISGMVDKPLDNDVPLVCPV